MKYVLTLFIAFLLCAAQLKAQTHSREAGFQTDNDSYLAKGSDKYYTNGIFFYYRQALSIANTNSSLQNKVLGFELGQKMFNPQGAVIPAAFYIDRPFAGYTYIGSTLNLLYKNESSLKLGAQLGITGPAAAGKETQKLIHHIFGLYQPQGWRYQIQNDVELNLSANYTRLLLRTTGFDVSATGYANLGNGFTGAGAGPILRAGLFNQLFNSVSTQSTAITNIQAKPLHQFELFAYYKPMANVIGYDATVQGSLYRDHPVGVNEITLEPERFVFSQQIGLSYAGSRIVVDASAIYHSKDVVGMRKKHQWGSLTALYRFR
ncbi:lipid A deacylase LpxR family protein [Mucilaginibacter koreensis]